MYENKRYKYLYPLFFENFKLLQLSQIIDAQAFYTP